MDSKNNNVFEDWQTSRKSFRERSKYLLDSSSWTDCKFLVGTGNSSLKEFEAHKLILSMTSPVFATMFHGGLPEIDYPIKIIDTQPDAFKSMLEYIYSDTINVYSIDQACELCYVAKKYMLPHLLKRCMDYIWSDVDSDTALRAYEFAKLFEDSEISEKSMLIIKDKTEEVLSKAGSMNISYSTLLDIFHQDLLNVPSEIYLFNFLQSWVKTHAEKTDNEECDVDKARALARNALSKIRFLVMDATEFADVPAQSQLLTKDESFAILLNISSPNKPTKYPLPTGFSTCRIPRTKLQNKLASSNRKLYIRRPIADASVQLNNGCLTDKLHFVASDNITLFGIQIPSQIMQMDLFCSSLEESHIILHGSTDSAKVENSTLIPKSKYRELLIMFVKEVKNPKNNWFTHTVSLVEHNSILNVMFTTPAAIQSGLEYELTVTLHKEGYYLVGSFNEPLELFSDNVKVTLIPASDTAFLSSLIFSQ